MYAFANVHDEHISFVYNLDIKLKPKLYAQNDLLRSLCFYSTYVRIKTVPSSQC